MKMSSYWSLEHKKEMIENTRGEHHMKYSLGETRNDPMPLGEVLEKVREGCEMHMNQLDNDGYCAESDDYVVALAFFEDYIEKLMEAGEIT